jgi:4-hydroxythreonine-4-phosphate dehydrogenase
MSNTGSRADAPPPRIGISAGEPAGIGPDLVIRTAMEPAGAALVAIADPVMLQARARMLGIPLRLREVAHPRDAGPHAAGELAVLPVPLAAPPQAGRPDPRNARAMLAALERAARHCLERELDALVTGPVQKSVVNDAGIPFTGHTEFLGELCGAEPVMMLAGDGLRVVVATTHLPLSRVADALTAGRLERTLRIVLRDLQSRFGITAPRLRVCGLNPHAGEQGHLGREEITIISPVLERLRAEGFTIEGPVPADTAFVPASLDGIDAVVTMFHDQGLPVLKAHGFGSIVNITLGLPIIRTSVDHGTALSIAGTGRADSGSFMAALHLACELARRARL